MIRILESASLGPKRALVVARLGDELLVLGSSEAGVALLATRPAPLADELGAPAAAPAPARAPDLLGWLGRLRRPASAPAAGFERVLTESLEDAELRRKLAAGHAGSVR
jgi:flagellar biogenesis protein FliO